VPAPSDIDQLLAPIALYPDALLGQILLCSTNPAKVGALNEWLATQTVKGTALQDAAKASGFSESFVALVLFPDVVRKMNERIDWTTKIGAAFKADRSAVFGSIQRLRKKAQDAGKLKDSPQQDIETKTTSSGQQVIVIEPTNPQVVYVPQYNPQTVYTTSTVVVQEDNSSNAVAAGLIGFTAGVALGAAMDNDYYYGPAGWRGGFYMYDDAWDDWYDHREDAREDWMDHREDLYENRSDVARNAQEQRTERTQARQQNASSPEAQARRDQARQNASSPEAQARRDQAQQNASSPEAQARRDQAKQNASSPEAQARRDQAKQNASTPEAQAQREQRRSEAQASGDRPSTESRGYSRDASRGSGERSGTRSDAFSGYSSGKSERAASSRGQKSRSSSRGGGGGGRRR
jgi:hypothetical protein